MTLPTQQGQIDRILLTEANIVPSTGFAASVLGAVRAENAVPAPIPFPWKLTVPGFAGLLVAAVLGLFVLGKLMKELGGEAVLSIDQSHVLRWDGWTWDWLGWLRSGDSNAVFTRTEAIPALIAIALSFVSLALGRYFTTGDRLWAR